MAPNCHKNSQGYLCVGISAYTPQRKIGVSAGQLSRSGFITVEINALYHSHLLSFKFWVQ